MSNEKPEDKLLVCNCQQTMSIDGAALGKALGADGPVPICRELCRSEVAVFERALAAGGRINVACTQEAPLFLELAEDRLAADQAARETAAAATAAAAVRAEAPQNETAAGKVVDLLFTNIRERAGWCRGGADAPETTDKSDKTNMAAKMAALLLEGGYRSQPAKAITLNSQGICLVYGAGQEALEVAEKLSRSLSVSLLLSDADGVMPPASATLPIHQGRIKTAGGHLGAFKVVVDDYAPMLPSSKAALDFAMVRNGASSSCDLIFDMSGGAPLFSAHKHVDGYVHVDPNHRAGIAEAMFDIIDMVGEFEKPLYVSYDKTICAHSRSGIIGCSNCLDNCPTGAITGDGDHVRIDSAICGGCGNCSALCPTGAVSYAYPVRHDVIARAQLLLSSYLAAGGKRPCILLHDDSHGASMISSLARHGRGLPGHVLPLSIYSLFQTGHEAIAAMLGAGAEHIALLVPPDKSADLPALADQVSLMSAILDGLGYAVPRVHIINERDPDAVEAALYAMAALPAIAAGSIDPVGSKRDVARNALAKLHAAAPQPCDTLDLPAGAPYGRVSVDTGGCTLCLACVGACPVGALSDHPDHPELAFTEAACVQCGVCVATCPEKVITLAPRYNFLPDAMSAVVLNREEPFQCIACGKPFGTKSMVEKVVGRLQGHSMFQSEEQIRLIQMCDNCRVVTLAESKDDPFRGGARPKTRTTDDYIAADAEAARAAKESGEVSD